MKIALITKEFLPNRGGAERYAEGLTKTLAQSGHEIHVISSSFPPNMPHGIEAHVASPDKKHRVLPNAFRLVYAIRDIVSSLKCDIVYALTPHYPAHLYRAGDGVHEHWLNLKYPHLLPRLFAKHMPRRFALSLMEHNLYAAQNCRGFITNSHLVKRHIMQYYHVAEKRIFVVYNGVDGTIFYPDIECYARQRHALAIPDSILLILFVAHNWERKGLSTLLHGAARLIKEGRATVVVIGRGKVSKWHSLMHELQISDGVSFVEPTNKIADWYRCADVMVLPTHYDPFANVCLEAMASGTPVITTKENGACELIDSGKNGYVLSHIQAYEELESQLFALCQRDFREHVGIQALQTALGHTLKDNANQTVSCFKACL